MAITLDDVNEEFSRSVMASQVTLPIEIWVQYLNLAQFALTHGASGTQAEIARLTAERDELAEAYAAHHVAAMNEAGLRMKAERDTIAADAFEAAAKALQNVADNWDCGHMESRLCDCRRDAEQWGLAADETRALTPADAIATREARDRAKVAEGMREAAEVYARSPAIRMNEWVDRFSWRHAVYRAILARAAEVEAGK